MDWLQIDGKEIPLLEAPQKYENPPRRILYVIFKHKKLIRNVFLLLIVPMVLYLLSRPTEYTASNQSPDQAESRLSQSFTNRTRRG